MLAHRVKIEGIHYPALTLLMDSLRNERFAHSDPSREAELLSPGMKELSTGIILRKISQGNELGAAHPAGFPSVDSSHSFMFCIFQEQKKNNAQEQPHLYYLQQLCRGNTGSWLQLIPICSYAFLPTFLPSTSNPSSAFPGFFLSQTSSLASSSCLTLEEVFFHPNSISLPHLIVSSSV